MLALASSTFPPSCVHLMDLSYFGGSSVTESPSSSPDRPSSITGWGPGPWSVWELPGRFQWAVSGSLGLPPSTEPLFPTTRGPPQLELAYLLGR